MVLAMKRLSPLTICCVAVAALTIFRFWNAATLPLTPDETYYLLWARSLQAGYYDHPPMIALFVDAGLHLFGPTPLGVRFAAPIAGAITSAALWISAESLFPHRNAGVAAVALFNTTLFAAYAGVFMTPDVPLLMFWSLVLAALCLWLSTSRDFWWIVAGLALGLSFESKYTAFLLLAGVGGWLLTTNRGRVAVGRPWCWVGLALALTVFFPNLVWNFRHHWAAFTRQGGRIGDFRIGSAFNYVADLVAGQVGLATPFIAWLAVAGIRGALRKPAEQTNLLLWTTLTPAAVFLQHALGDRVQANWPAIMYPSALVLAAGSGGTLRRWLAPGVLTGAGLTAVLYVQAYLGMLPIPADRDPAALQLAGWKSFAQRAAAGSPAYLTSDGYATLSALAYYAPKNVAVVGFDERWGLFDFGKGKVRKGQAGRMVSEDKAPIPPCPKSATPLVRDRDLQAVHVYLICPFDAATDGVVLPRP